MKLGPSVGEWDAIPFPGVPGPDNMDYQRGDVYKRQAMETVAAMAKMVTMDMERRMLTRLAVEKKAVPLMAVKITTDRTSTMTAAQFRSW